MTAFQSRSFFRSGRFVGSIVFFCLGFLPACGTDEDAEHSDTKFLTGAGPARGHEDITRMGVDKANQQLESLLGQRPFPDILYGLNAASSDNPLVKGNFESDFPQAPIINFHNAAGADWHNDGRLQHIHSLRGAENGIYRNNRSSCELQQQTIRTITTKAMDALHSGDRESGLYWVGHATHVIQDSFSAAHTDRRSTELQPEGRAIYEFCTYGTRFHGICYHDTADLRDRIWHDGLSCQIDPTNRSEECLRGEAKWAVDATASYLALVGRLMAGNSDQETLLQDFFTNAGVSGSGYFDCGKIPDSRLGLSEVTIKSSNSPVSQCHSNWKQAGADLNDGAMGKFVELCQQYGEVPNPVSGITVVAGRDARCPDGFERNDTNLNDGTPRGEKLYLCVSRQPGTPLMEIKATSSKSGGNRCGDGFHWLGVDLNKGAGGKYVFLCYR
ncbi:MAG TPA: hypothetical protein VE954_03380 [Oligoflexus sp.]|uniref:hypothetical protein n=1 Tax=Oligoflexus sp. TaxID=1971216 RepID=UPI002D5B101A|nr:hypothetical protein [Oligoflexus sp.]HYX32129.1 hypothetical protein [Oligoflexus sp.]